MHMPIGKLRTVSSGLLARHPRALGARCVLAVAVASVLGPISYRANAAAVDTWTGAQNANWDTTSTNWSNGGTGLYTDGDTVIFSGGSNTGITVQAAGVGPASTTFQSTSTNYGFTNASGTTGITGASTLTLANTYTGVVTLNSANAYTGATAVNGGTLELANASAIGGSALSMGNGGTLSLRGDADTTFATASFGNFTAGSTYNISVNDITAGGAGKTMSLKAPAGGGGGTSSTTLKVSSTTGDTLKFTTAFQTNSNSGSAFTYTIGQNVFNLNGANVILDGGVSMGNNGDGSIVVNSASGNDTLTINGTVTTNNNRTTAGIVNSGTLILNNAVSLSGSNQGFFVFLNGGTLNVQNAGAIRNNSGAALSSNRAGFTINGGTLDNTSGSAKTLTYSPTILLNGDFAFGTSGSTSANNLNIGTGAVYLGGAASSSQTTRTITTNGSATLTIGGAIANGSNGTTTNVINLTKAGTGTLALNGTNIYTGTTTVQNGTLALGASGTIGDNLALGVSGGTTGTLDVTAKAAYSQTNVSGIGTINIGTGKTVTVTGSLAPGFSTGEIDVTGGLALGTSTTMELANAGGVAGTSSDFAKATGALTYGGALSIANYGGFDLAAQNGSYNLFDFASESGNFASVTVGGFTLLQSGNTWTGGTGSTHLTFDQGDGVLTVAVPEPATLGAMLLAGAGLLARRRRSA